MFRARDALNDKSMLTPFPQSIPDIDGAAERTVMAKRGKKRAKKITTEEALERLLGRKAAKRLRRLAVRVAKEDRKSTGSKKR